MRNANAMIIFGLGLLAVITPGLASANTLQKHCIITSQPHNREVVESIDVLKSSLGQSVTPVHASRAQFGQCPGKTETNSAKTKLLGPTLAQWVGDNNCGNLYIVDHGQDGSTKLGCMDGQAESSVRVVTSELPAIINDKKYGGENADKVNIFFVTCGCVPPTPAAPTVKLCVGYDNLIHPMEQNGLPGFFQYAVSVSKSPTNPDERKNRTELNDNKQFSILATSFFEANKEVTWKSVRIALTDRNLASIEPFKQTKEVAGRFVRLVASDTSTAAPTVTAADNTLTYGYNDD